MIDEPSNGVIYGGIVAAPVFSEVVQQTLRMMSVAARHGRAAARSSANDAVKESLHEPAPLPSCTC